MISSDGIKEPKLYNPEVKFIGYPVSLVLIGIKVKKGFIQEHKN